MRVRNVSIQPSRSDVCVLSQSETLISVNECVLRVYIAPFEIRLVCFRNCFYSLLMSSFLMLDNNRQLVQSRVFFGAQVSRIEELNRIG